jgi:hypothetical protein
MSTDNEILVKFRKVTLAIPEMKMLTGTKKCEKCEFVTVVDLETMAGFRLQVPVVEMYGV